MNLEEIIQIVSKMSYHKQVMFNQLLGIDTHIDHSIDDVNELVLKDPNRFIKIGSMAINRESFTGTDEEYKFFAISVAKYLYNRCRLIFQFYDKKVNQDELVKTLKKEYY